MQKTACFVFILVTALSCRTIAKQEGTWDGRILFSPGNGPSTKIDSPSDIRDSNIDHWCVIVYDNNTGKKVFQGENSGGASIECSLNHGRLYSAFAIANHSSIEFDAPLDINDIALKEFSLEENSPKALLMSGVTSFLALRQNSSVVIPLQRLVSKVEIREISLDMDNLTESYVIRKIYLTNAYLKSRLLEDFPHEEMAQEDSPLWYNLHGYHLSGEIGALDYLLSDINIDLDLAAGCSYMGVHTFFTFPNAKEDPSLQTKLVIQAQIGPKTYYYVIPLPRIQRNNSYIVTKASIRNYGSLDQEGTVPGAVDINLTVIGNGYERRFTVGENS